MRFGSYAPENFDLTFQGTVTVRRALQLSLNVPAVAVLDKVGASRFAARLAQAGGAVRAAAGRGAGARHGPRRRRREAQRSRRRSMPGSARRGTTVPITERVASGEEPADAAPAARSGRRLVRRQRPARHAAAGERRRRPHRLQDRHLLRLSRRLVGRLRRQAHHRRLGRPAGRRAGARPGRACRRRADPVRCLRPHRQAADAAAGGAKGRAGRSDGQAAAAAAALPSRRAGGRERASRSCASCSRRTARGSSLPTTAPASPIRSPSR